MGYCISCSHIDFYLPTKGKETEIDVPLVFEGIEDIQKKTGGNLVKEIQFIEVKGMIDKLPKEIKVNLSLLEKIGDRIFVKDLNIPEGVKILKDKEDVVAVIVGQAKEEIEEEETSKKEEAAEEKEGKEEKKETGNK